MLECVSVSCFMASLKLLLSKIILLIYLFVSSLPSVKLYQSRERVLITTLSSVSTKCLATRGTVIS